MFEIRDKNSAVKAKRFKPKGLTRTSYNLCASVNASLTSKEKKTKKKGDPFLHNKTSL